MSDKAASTQSVVKASKDILAQRPDVLVGYSYLPMPTDKVTLSLADFPADKQPIVAELGWVSGCLRSAQSSLGASSGIRREQWAHNVDRLEKYLTVLQAGVFGS